MTISRKKSAVIVTAVVMIVAAMLYFPSGLLKNADWGGSASAAEITPSEPNTDSNGTYQIGTASELYWFAGLVNGTLTDGTSKNESANAILTADITVNENVLNDKGELNDGSFRSWTPIGTTDTTNEFSGKFDGADHTISGLYADTVTSDPAGMFKNNYGSISNLNIKDSYFKANATTGGICTYNFGTITNCSFSGTVNGGSFTGGICGYNAGTTISNCYNTGTITGNGNTGGICGYNDERTISNCYNTGTITGNGNTGGICGYNFNGTISNCYNTGTITGSKNTGGICGYNFNGTISNCFYLDGTADKGIGLITGATSETESKADDKFQDGEVAYLLSQDKDGSVWGQKLSEPDKENFPVLGGKKVVMNGDTYVNAPQITEYNISLASNIDLNIKLDVSDGFTDWKAYVNGTELTATNENGSYTLVYPVAAKDLDKKFTFEIRDTAGKVVWDSFETSVSEYLNNVKTEKPEYAELAKAVENYGKAAKEYFADGTVASVDGITASSLENYSMILNTQNLPENVEYIGSTLLLKSGITLRHYFKCSSAPEFEIGGISAATSPFNGSDSGIIYFDIENIEFNQLKKAYTIEADGKTVITNCSVLSYANSVLNDEAADENLKNLVKALYILSNTASNS